MSSAALVAAMTEVDVLEKQAHQASSEPMPYDQVIPFLSSVSASFLSPSLNPQNPVWINGAGDCYVTQLGYAAWVSKTDGTALRLFDTGLALGATNTGAGVSTYTMWNQLFDFKWNVKRRTSMADLGVGFNCDGYLSRQALGNMETGKWLTFRPRLVRMGDGLNFSVVPTGYNWCPRAARTVTNGARYSVHMMIAGFRLGGVK